MTNQHRTAPPATSAVEQKFDGVICFGGEDWWYHNRGHYDMQLMQRFAEVAPVLYVNSIGMRMPRAREGRMFIRRLQRKLRSMAQGTVRISDRFAVTSPLHLPGRAFSRFADGFLPWQVLAAARTLGIERPLLWIACPPAAAYVEKLQQAGAVGMVYQRTDRTECFAGVDHASIRTCDRWLKARADVTLFCSTLLLEEEAEQCRQPCYVDHGVDADMFIAAGTCDPDDIAPPDLAALPRPRIGFVGGIDAHTFDPALLCDVARLLPEAHFALTGACSLPRDWCSEANVHLLGQKPYERVAAYMAGCDVLIMLWNRSRWIDACNPIKLKEYLAVGRPIVTTPFAEALRYRGHLHIASGAHAFAEALRSALQERFDRQPGCQRVRAQTWDRKAYTIIDRLAKLGLHPPDPRALATWTHSIEEAGQLAKTLTSEACQSRPAPACQSRHALHEIEPKPLACAVPMSETQRDLRGNSHISDAPPRLAAILMMAGGLQPSTLMQQAGCHVLDLWISEHQTVLDLWLDQLAALRTQSQPLLPVRIITSSACIAPWPRSDLAGVCFEQERQLFRGCSGVVRDSCAEYAAQDHVLVVEAGRAPLADLEGLWRAHARSGADVTIAAHADESPAGAMFARIAALQTAPTIGFVDMREQWLPRLHMHGFRAAKRTISGWLRPLQTGRDLLDAARAVRLQQWSAGSDLPQRAGAPENHAAAIELSEDGASIGLSVAQSQRIVCPGSEVDATASVVDSLIMPGARVQSGATVTRSVICSDCVIQAGADIADAVVSTASHGVARARSWT